MNLASTLSYNYLFRGLPKNVLAGIAASAELKLYFSGDIIVRQCDRSSDLFVVLSGHAVIHGADGESVAEFGPGSVIGEIALIDGEPRSATVVASGLVEVAAISASVLRGMMEVDPLVARTLSTNIARILCMRVRTMNDHLREMRSGPTELIA